MEILIVVFGTIDPGRDRKSLTIPIPASLTAVEIAAIVLCSADPFKDFMLASV